MATEGEGSRGGHIIGHTESGLPIYESHSSHTLGKIVGTGIGVGAAYVGYRKSGDWAKSTGIKARGLAIRSGHFFSEESKYKYKTDLYSKAAKAAKPNSNAKYRLLYKEGHNAAKAATSLKSAEKAGKASFRYFMTSKILEKISKIGRR